MVYPLASAAASTYLQVSSYSMVLIGSSSIALAGERRRAAVNRALRLSDSIERLKTDMIEEVHDCVWCV